MNQKSKADANTQGNSSSSSSSGVKRKAESDIPGPKLKQARLPGAPAKPDKPVNEAESEDPRETYDGKWIIEDRERGIKYYKPRGKDTWLWSWFDHHTNFGDGFVQCKIPLPKKDKHGEPKICLEWLKYDGSTSVIHNHAKAKKKHPAWYDEQKAKEEGEDSKDGKDQKSKGGGQRKWFVGKLGKFHDALAIWIGTSLRPFTVVEDFAFLDMFKLLTGRANFELPSADTLATKCRLYGNEVRKELKNVLAKIDSGSVTFDFWTSISLVPMLGVTFHHVTDELEMRRVVLAIRKMEGAHTADACLAKIRELIKEFGLKGKLVAATADNTSNVQAVCRALERSSEVLVGLGCGNHQLQLSLKDAAEPVPQVKAADQKCTNFVTYIHKSPETMEKYQDEQKQCGSKNPVKPRAPGTTRWNGKCDMIESMVGNTQPVARVLNWSLKDKKTKRKDVSEIDFLDHMSVLEGILPALQLIRKLTKFLETEKRPTVSRVAPMILNLAPKLDALILKAGMTGPVAAFIKGLKESINKRFPEWRLAILVAMLLDPMIKDSVMSPDEKKRAWSALEAEYLKVAASAIIQSGESAAKPASAVPDEVLELLGDIAKGDSMDIESKDEKQPKIASGSVAAQQWVTYKSLERPPATEDALQWWKRNRENFPYFIPLVKRYFSIQVSSSSVERVFSTGGNLVSKKRSSLAPTTMEDLVLMRDNRDMLAYHLTLSEP